MLGQAGSVATLMASCPCEQVFDSGLLGEGVLHLVHWAQQRLLQPHAVLVGAANHPNCVHTRSPFDFFATVWGDTAAELNHAGPTCTEARTVPQPVVDWLGREAGGPE